MAVEPVVLVTLDLADLERNPPMALGEKRAPCFVEAAALCLDSQGHVSGVTLDVTRMRQNVGVQLLWSLRHGAYVSWDERESTEHGAVAVGLSLLRHTMELEALDRGRQPCGFDYLLGTRSGEYRAVVEISGIRRGKQAQVSARMTQKKQQIHERHWGFVAYALVVEFGCPKAELDLR